MNKIVPIDEHIYTLPTPPRSQEDVLFSKESKQNQYWRRVMDFPKTFWDYIPGLTQIGDAEIYNNEGLLITVSEKEARNLIFFRDRELMRRQKGVWFMNNGELTYITGNHYFALQWGEMHGYVNPDTGMGFGEYREFQRDFFYFIDFVEKHPIHAGGYIAKAKKTGITQLMALMFLNESTMIRQKRFTMMSKSKPDAVGTNMMLYQHALEKMVPIMKPSISNLTQSSVKYGKVKRQLTGSRKSLKEAADLGEAYLKTSVEALPTVADAMDGPKIYRGHIDEFPKCENPYPQELFDKSSEATKLQQLIYGKQFYTSYPPEKDNRAFFEGRKIWQESSLATANELGKTKTGLVQFYISSLYSTEGTFDRYGKADEKKAFYLNEQDRKSAGGDRTELQKKKRQYSRNKKEAWESGGAGSTFNNIRLALQESDTIDEENSGARFYQEGYFEWSAGFMTRPRFIKLSENEMASGKMGKVRIYNNLYGDEICSPFNYQRDEKGRLQPNPDTNKAGACDPTDYKQKKDVVEGSKNSVSVFCGPDVLRNTRYGGINSNLLILEYYDRPDDPDEFLEDLIMIVLYTGCYIIIEGNKGWVVTSFKKYGLQNFLLLRDKKTGTIRPYKEGDEMSIINTSEDLINDYCRAIARYLREPQTDGEIDNMKYLRSTRLIRQLMDFDPLNTGPYDMVVSFGLGRLAVEALSIVKQERAKHENLYRPDLIRGIVEGFLDF